MGIADLKLRFVPLVVVVRELEAMQKQVLGILTQEQAACDRCYAKRSRIRIRNEGAKAVYLRGFESEFFAGDTSGGDRDREK